MWRNRTGEPELEFDDIQGDILVGLQKDFEWFVCFKILDVDKFRDFAREKLLRRLSSAADALESELKLQAHKKAGLTEKLRIAGLNIGFTQPGLEKLGFPDT